jgi:hypothetical protein
VGVEPGAHEVDLALLVGDDLLREPLQPGVVAVQQQYLRHVDGALVVRDHLGDEVAIGAARARRSFHSGVDALHRLVHEILEAAAGRRDEGRFGPPRRLRCGQHATVGVHPHLVIGSGTTSEHDGGEPGGVHAHPVLSSQVRRNDNPGLFPRARQEHCSRNPLVGLPKVPVE